MHRCSRRRDGEKMIQNFSCKNFRNITAENLSFEKINILIGPNNSGKTNFIRALTFLAEMLDKAEEGNLKSSFLNAAARNGWGHMLNKGATSDKEIKFSWKLDLDGEPVEYVFACTVGNSIEDCNIILEELNSAIENLAYPQAFNYFRCHNSRLGKGVFSSSMVKGSKNKRLYFNLDSKESLIRQFKDILLNSSRIYGNTLVRGQVQDLLYKIQDYFSQYSVYATSKFNTEKMRLPVNVKSLDSTLNYDGSNFTNVFNHYKSVDIIWKNKFENFMKELIPNLQAVDTVTFYDNLIFKLVYGGEQYDLSDVSEGTLKGLILNMLINMPMEKKKSMLAIDEPENNLHPAWQKVIGNWIQTSENYEQCFVSTHSPDFLDVFTEEFIHGNVAVFVFDSNNAIKKITYEDIADELGDWELGDLYRTNDPALGGWPW